MEIFSKTRQRIVCITMLILFFIIIAMTVSIYFFSYYSINKSNSEMLQQYIYDYSLENQPKDKPDEPAPDGEREPKREKFAYNISTFYSVAFSVDGEILSVDNGNNKMGNQGFLEKLARDVYSEKKKSGRIGGLMYKTEQRSDYTLVAFIDCAVSDSNLHQIVTLSLIIGIIALFIAYFVSLVFSKIVIKPLRENDDRQREFVSDASHELKTPIAIITANADILKYETGDNKWLSNIIYEADRMNHLVVQLLDLAYAENSTQEKTRIDYSDLIMGEILPIEPVAYERGIRIETQIEENVYVKGIRDQLCQLVSILIDNAIKYTENKSNIEVRMKRSSQEAILSVTNSGKEIPEEIRSHLFDRFYRMDKVRNSECGHYGLGLSIAHAITENHKGKISVNCDEGKVIFTVTIPAYAK